MKVSLVIQSSRSRRRKALVTVGMTSSEGCLVVGAVVKLHITPSEGVWEWKSPVGVSGQSPGRRSVGQVAQSW